MIHELFKSRIRVKDKIHLQVNNNKQKGCVIIRLFEPNRLGMWRVSNTNDANDSF